MKKVYLVGAGPGDPGLITLKGRKALEQAESRGLIERDGAQIKPTERGFDFLSELQALFLA